MSDVYYCITNHPETSQPKITFKSHLGLINHALLPCSFIRFATKLLGNWPHSVSAYPRPHPLRDRCRIVCFCWSRSRRRAPLTSFVLSQVNGFQSFPTWPPPPNSVSPQVLVILPLSPITYLSYAHYLLDESSCLKDTSLSQEAVSDLSFRRGFLWLQIWTGLPLIME